MAFNPVTIPVTEILQSNFVTDVALISNANDLLLKDKLEDLINNLEIDTNSMIIGVDNPISSIKTDTLIMQDTGFIYQTGNPAQVISKLEKNVSNESVLTIDIVNLNSALNANTVNATSLFVTGIGTFNDVVNNGIVQNYSASVESSENVTVSATEVSNIAIGTLTLSYTSRQNVYVTIEVDSSIYTGGALVSGLLSMHLVIDFDTNNPPLPNTEFTIHIVDIVEQGTGISIISAMNAYPLDLKIKAGINQSTTNQILLHSDFVSNGKQLMVQGGNLEKYGSNVSFTYRLDQNSFDRLLIKSLVQVDIV